MTLAPENRNVGNMMSVFKTQSAETLKTYSPVNSTSLPVKLVETILKKLQTYRQIHWIGGKSAGFLSRQVKSAVMLVTDFQLLLMKVWPSKTFLEGCPSKCLKETKLPQDKREASLSKIVCYKVRNRVRVNSQLSMEVANGNFKYSRSVLISSLAKEQTVRCQHLLMVLNY